MICGVSEGKSSALGESESEKLFLSYAHHSLSTGSKLEALLPGLEVASISNSSGVCKIFKKLLIPTIG